MRVRVAVLSGVAAAGFVSVAVAVPVQPQAESN